MSRLGKSIIPSSRLSPFLPCRSNGRQFRPTRAKKPSIGENSQARSPTFSLRISKAFLARSAVAVFALGFLDAGQKRHGREDWCLKRRQLKVDDPRNKNATGEKTVTQSEGNQRSMILTDKKIIKDKV
ncbi:hypothetical protein COCNU_13G006010 [Cocos nucifera]|uniref:DUF7887 domain-containing protein n=1 Tax=Cocos nucifera TaxID=13894 RepID=A0A8K0NAZ1_COCNU|nr:hypothetical protein COCNU_13G006010 [Cocos nucifera]